MTILALKPKKFGIIKAVNSKRTKKEKLANLRNKGQLLTTHTY